MQICQNCIRQISDGERTFRVGSYVVCEDCYASLLESGALLGVSYVEDPLEAIAAAAAYTPRRRSRTKPGNPSHFIICPNANCGFRGSGIKKQKASSGVAIVLILLWLGFGFMSGNDPALWIVSVAAFIAWLGYTIFRHGKFFECPRCGAKSRDA